MGLLSLLIMSSSLGAGCYGFGNLPLFISFSKNHLARLSWLGTGLLLGAALGVVIPEGIETLVESRLDNEDFPAVQIAMALLSGFTFMMVVDNLSHAHPESSLPLHSVKPGTNTPTSAEFDAELGELERDQNGQSVNYSSSNGAEAADEASLKRAYPLTVGLLMHGLADGLALGVSAISSDESDLSLVVFFALVIHKAPTALALTTSLLSNSLPRADCKKHIAAFAASTPFGAIVSYTLVSFLGGGSGNWTGLALLVSGGTFLYVATVLQPVSDSASNQGSKRLRVALIALGMFTPLFIGTVLGHGHGHEHTPHTT